MRDHLPDTVIFVSTDEGVAIFESHATQAGGLRAYESSIPAAENSIALRKSKCDTRKLPDLMSRTCATSLGVSQETLCRRFLTALVLYQGLSLGHTFHFFSVS